MGCFDAGLRQDRPLTPGLLPGGERRHRVAVPGSGPLCYHVRPFSQDFPSMIETNPILAQIADLKGRVESLRGYL